MKYDYRTEPSTLSSKARSSFVQKVYSILSVQLIITALFVLMNIYIPTFAYIQARYSSLLWISFAMTLIPMIVLST